GYFKLFEQDNYDLEPFLDRLGKDWQILEMSHKPFPSGRLTHGTVDALAKLMTEHEFTPDEIQRVTCKVPPLVHRLVGRPLIAQPAANYAKLCLRFVAGLYLARGRVDVPDFRGTENLQDPEIHRLASLVDVVLDDNPDQNALDPQTVTVALKSGAQHSITLPHVYGHPKAPLSDAENVEKFTRCAGYGVVPLPQARMQALVDTVAGIEAETDVARLVSLTLADGRVSP